MAPTGIVFDITRFAVHDGPGIRTTVFLKGCPLDCRWCHNPESRKLRPQAFASNGHSGLRRWGAGGEPGVIGREVGVDEVIDLVERDRAFYDESGGGVTISGGEPLVQFEFLTALLETARVRELHTTLDTSGFAPWHRYERLLPLVRLFLYDVKLIDSAAHREHVGVGNELILDNLGRLHDAGATIQLRVPLIPGITDTDDNLRGVARLAKRLPRLRGVSLLPYNPIGEGKVERLGLERRIGPFETQEKAALERARSHFDVLSIPVRIGG